MKLISNHNLNFNAAMLLAHIHNKSLDKFLYLELFRFLPSVNTSRVFQSIPFLWQISSK